MILFPSSCPPCNLWHMDGSWASHTPCGRVFMCSRLLSFSAIGHRRRRKGGACSNTPTNNVTKLIACCIAVRGIHAGMHSFALHVQECSCMRTCVCVRVCMCMSHMCISHMCMRHMSLYDHRGPAVGEQQHITIRQLAHSLNSPRPPTGGN